MPSEKEENEVNRRSEREQSQVYLNYAKPQGGKLQVNRRSEREQSQVYLNYAKPQGGKRS